MKRFFLAVAMIAAVSCSGPKGVKPTENVIFFLVDGCSSGTLSLSRWYKQYTDPASEGLNIDPYICGMMRPSHIDAVIAGSAGSMTTLMCGELVSKQQIGMYPKPNDRDMYPVDSTRTYHPLTDVAEVLKREYGKGVGIVATTYYCHATPAATTAHAYDRGEYNTISAQMASLCDVAIAGGTSYLTEKTRSVLNARGVQLIERDFKAFRDCDAPSFWAILAPEDMNYDIDRSEDEPSLAEMTDKAIKALSRNRKGFFLMVEGSQVDFAAHANDPAGIVSDFLAFDEAVGVALDFAKKNGNTTVVITADHGTSGVSIGERGFAHYSSRSLGQVLEALPQYKATASRIARLMGDAKPSTLKDTMMKYTGLDLTDEENEYLVKASGKTELDYMEVGNNYNLQSAIAKIMGKHTHVGYTSGNHTGDDVFLAAYNPYGFRPEGFHTNVRLNEYVCRAAGLPKPVREYSDDYYRPQDEVLAGIEATIGTDEFGDQSLEFTLQDGRNVKLISNTTLAYVNGKQTILDLPSVYVPKKGSFYLQGDILKKL